ncbi:hypothetical protein F5Y09DRAFT_342795 [Xylaria sp. FL1042]|nr:hypothetical protein F5Y09DRAFT_342795 [Xylaria sp. FL1042]
MGSIDQCPTTGEEGSRVADERPSTNGVHLPQLELLDHPEDFEADNEDYGHGGINGETNGQTNGQTNGERDGEINGETNGEMEMGDDSVFREDPDVVSEQGGIDIDMERNDYRAEPSYSTEPDEERTRIIDEIEELYITHEIPLWTKMSMQDLASQIKLRASGQTESDDLVVRGLNGGLCVISFYGDEDNSDGHIRPGAKPTIDYHSIHDLLFGDRRPWDPFTAYLTMTVTWQNYRSSDIYLYDDHAAIVAAATAEVAERVREKKREWKTTTAYWEMQAKVRAYPPFARVRKLVGIALGGLVHRYCVLEPEVEEEVMVERSVDQYAFISTLQDLIAELLGIDPRVGPKCIVQDPALSEIDAAALVQLGMQVLDDPDGFLELDETSFLVTVAPCIPVKQIVADIARPVGMIWDRDINKTVSELKHERVHFPDHVSYRVEEMLNDYYDDMGQQFVGSDRTCPANL